MSDAIDVAGLRKSYGKVVALDGLDMTVATGEVHGFLGPNGAGKTTTIRILLGLLRSDGGLVRLLGGDPWTGATELHRRIAYVPGDVSLWPNFTGGEVIDLLGRLRGGVDQAQRRRRHDGCVATRSQGTPCASCCVVHAGWDQAGSPSLRRSSCHGGSAPIDARHGYVLAFDWSA